MFPQKNLARKGLISNESLHKLHPMQSADDMEYFFQIMNAESRAIIQKSVNRYVFNAHKAILC